VSGTSGSSGTSGTSGISAPSGTSGISGGSFTDQPNYLVKTTGITTLQSVDFLTVSGASPSGTLTVAGTVSATTLVETSTEASKMDIVPLLPPQLDKIVQLNPVSFRYRNNNEISIGLIAEEVVKIYPEFVSFDDDGSVTGVNYSKMSAVLIQGIKELKQIVDEQQSIINKLINK
jgi:hypothetical protein